jgi:hypothetical protein
MGAYPDLMTAFRGNADQARNHWLQFGIREGRQPSANFYAASYLARYDDLKIAFGNNYEAALRHWIDNGWREGRDATPNGRFPMGAIVRLPDNGATYVVDASGAKRWITSGPVFDGCGLSWNMAQDLRRAVIDALPSGLAGAAATRCLAAQFDQRSHARRGRSRCQAPHLQSDGLGWLWGGCRGPSYQCLQAGARPHTRWCCHPNGRAVPSVGGRRSVQSVRRR